MPKTKKGALAAEVSGLHLVQTNYQQILAATLAASTALTTGAGDPVEALIQCTGGTIRWRCDATAPTPTTGNIMQDGDTYVLRGETAIAAFKAIAASGSPILDIGYWG